MIKLNGFKLHKVKFRKDLGISAEYSIITSLTDSNAVRKNITENCSAAAHPDVQRIIARLRCHFAAIHGLLLPELVMKDLEDLEESEQSKLQSVVERITMTGVTFIGSDESDSKYIMSASVEVLANGHVGYSTPTIAQDDSRYEPSGELTELLEALNDEVYLYVTEKKYAQLSMEIQFGAASGDSDSEVPQKGVLF